LTETPVKVALEAGVEGRDKPVKCNRFFTDGQEKSRKPKQLKKNVRRVDSFGEQDEPCCIECAEPYLMSRGPTERLQCVTIIDWPTTVAPDSATSMFVATATLITRFRVCRLV
jgi:hypothetical protein